MLIQFLDYSLKKVQNEDLELLRNWRNNDVLEFMINKEYITAQMQQLWFERINNRNNFFFIIYKLNEPVGLIDIKEINWNLLTAETGIYIANNKHRESETPLMATIMSAAFIAKILRLQKLLGKVLSSNKKAIAYNLSTGFKIINKESDIVTMCIDNYKVLDKIIELKDKLLHLQKDKYKIDTHIILLINKQIAEDDIGVKWLIENKIKKYFPHFEIDTPINLL